jgi:cell division protein FtsW (lipid II flippase)
LKSYFSRKSIGILGIAAIFLGLYALILTLAPATRNRSWEVAYNFSHWTGFVVWLMGFVIVRRLADQHLPNRDPYLLPIMALLSGWGLLTIWRLTPIFGLRQTIWLGVALGVLALGFRLPADLNFLRRYKYLWLTGGLLLTAGTLIFGTNPMGFGPQLWLGGGGVYLQPSEPLKLLLVVYLSAYFADWQGVIVARGRGLGIRNEDNHAAPFRFHAPQLQILVPTVIMTGIALLLLLVQRDLGTASIFIFLYSVMVYLATGWRWVPVLSAGTLVGAGTLGYLVFDVIRIRVDAWLNPWLDPAGRSYQIVQSLLSVANGGLLGRGPGLGSPGLVPVVHSDFIFTALAEEAGFLGVIGFLVLLGLLIHRGIRIALQTVEPFQRYLAAGLTAFLASQSILIIGGNLRLLPLTGVTLPFVSYGGSSLLVSFVIGGILLKISTASNLQSPGESYRLQVKSFTPPVSRFTLTPINNLSTLLILALVGTALISGWWAVVRGPDLLTRTDNARRSIADRYVTRGELLARDGTPLAITNGEPGEYSRRVTAPALSPVLGYNHPIYGQSGLEASLDPYLRGTRGYDAVTIWWHHLLYGQPPPGLDVRLTLDLALQLCADELLQGHGGALIVLNAKNGEILALSSHPTYDANRIDETWDTLISDPRAPLINRVTQGRYPTGDLANILLHSTSTEIPALRLPLAESALPTEAAPLEMALAAATLTNSGVQPAPKIAQMVANPMGGWLLLPALETETTMLTPEVSRTTLAPLSTSDATWETTIIPPGEDLTWFIGGDFEHSLVVVVVLETADLELAAAIGHELMLVSR